ncbi:hypothetical protein GCM10010533_46910 [Mycolicibacterium pallens]
MTGSDFGVTAAGVVGAGRLVSASGDPSKRVGRALLVDGFATAPDVRAECAECRATPAPGLACPVDADGEFELAPSSALATPAACSPAHDSPTMKANAPTRASHVTFDIEIPPVFAHVMRSDRRYRLRRHCTGISPNEFARRLNFTGD